LLLTTYLSQLNLQAADAKERHLELEKRASALSYFHSERRADIGRLAADRTLAVFFSNHALGMSMEYGLRASLLSMQAVAEDLVRSKTLGGIALYRRILILDSAGKPIVDVGSASGAPLPGIDPGSTWPTTVELRVTSDARGDHAFLLQALVDRGQPLGAVVAEVAHDDVVSNLVQTQDGRTSPVRVETLPAAALTEGTTPTSPAVVAGRRPPNGTRVRIPETPLFS
jgi:hypothetical protein